MLRDPSGYSDPSAHGNLLEDLRRCTDPHPLHVLSAVHLHHQLADIVRHHLSGNAHALIQEHVKRHAQQPGWRDTRRVRRTRVDSR